MKKNIYKLLAFLNRNKVIVGVFIIAISFLFTANGTSACDITDVGCMLDAGLGSLLSGMGVIIISIAAFTLQSALGIFVDLTSWLVNSPQINTAWILVRDIVNMFFIFFLLFTSIAKLVGKESILKHKKAVSQIIFILMGAFLVNFSKAIFGVVIDISQIITLQFTNAFADSLVNLSSIFSAMTTGVTAGNGAAALTGVLILVFSLAFVGVCFSAVLYFLIRAVSFGIYTALSPLWFFFMSFPIQNKMVDQLKKDTVDKFFALAMGGPIFAFYLWISLMLFSGPNNIVDNVDTGFNGPGTADTDIKQPASLEKPNTNISTSVILKMVTAIAVMLFAQKQAMSLSKEAGSVLGKGFNDLVDKTGKMGMKPLDGLKNSAKNVAKTAGSMASDTLGKAKDTAMGGIRNSISNSNGALATGIKKLGGIRDNFNQNAIDRQARVGQRATQQKALDAALLSGDAKKIKEAREAISARQIDQGKRVSADIRKAGGFGNYVGNGTVKYAKNAAIGAGAIAAGAATLATGGAAAGLLAGGLGVIGGTSAALGGLGIVSGAGTGAFGALGNPTQESLDKRITSLKEKKEQMEKDQKAGKNVTKADIERVDKDIEFVQKQKAKIEAQNKTNEASQKLKFNKKNYKEYSDLTKEDKDINDKIKSNGLENVGSIIGTNKDIVSSSDAEIKKLQDKFKESKSGDERRSISQQIKALQDKKNEASKKISNIKSTMTPESIAIFERQDQIAKRKKELETAGVGTTQEDLNKAKGKIGAADKGISEAQKAVTESRDKAAEIKKDDSDSIKKFKAAKGRIEGNDKYKTDGAFDKSKVNLVDLVPSDNNIDEFMSMISLKGGFDKLSAADKSHIEKHQKKIISAMQKKNDEDLFKEYKAITKDSPALQYLTDGLSVKDANGESRIKGNMKDALAKRYKREQRSAGNRQVTDEDAKKYAESNIDSFVSYKDDEKKNPTNIVESSDKLMEKILRDEMAEILARPSNSKKKPTIDNVKSQLRKLQKEYSSDLSDDELESISAEFMANANVNQTASVNEPIIDENTPQDIAGQETITRRQVNKSSEVISEIKNIRESNVPEAEKNRRATEVYEASRDSMPKSFVAKVESQAQAIATKDGSFGGPVKSREDLNAIRELDPTKYEKIMKDALGVVTQANTKEAEQFTRTRSTLKTSLERLGLSIDKSLEQHMANLGINGANNDTIKNTSGGLDMSSIMLSATADFAKSIDESQLSSSITELTKNMKSGDTGIPSVVKVLQEQLALKQQERAEVEMDKNMAADEALRRESNKEEEGSNKDGHGFGI